MPLLLETSREAAFLKPMVISISFGLIFGTALVLILLPAILVLLESLRARALRIRSQFVDYLKTSMPAGALAVGSVKATSKSDPATQVPVSEKGGDHET